MLSAVPVPIFHFVTFKFTLGYKTLPNNGIKLTKKQAAGFVQMLNLLTKVCVFVNVRAGY